MYDKHGCALRVESGIRGDPVASGDGAGPLPRGSELPVSRGSLA